MNYIYVIGTESNYYVIKLINLSCIYFYSHSNANHTSSSPISSHHNLQFIYKVKRVETKSSIFDFLVYVCSTIPFSKLEPL